MCPSFRFQDIRACCAQLPDDVDFFKVGVDSYFDLQIERQTICVVQANSLVIQYFESCEERRIAMQLIVDLDGWMKISGEQRSNQICLNPHGRHMKFNKASSRDYKYT